MAEAVTRTLPAQFIEDLGRDYGTQIAALTSLPVDTTKFAPQVAAQDALQTAAYTQATDAATGCTGTDGLPAVSDSSTQRSSWGVSVKSTEDCYRGTATATGA